MEYRAYIADQCHFLSGYYLGTFASLHEAKIKTQHLIEQGYDIRFDKVH